MKTFAKYLFLAATIAALAQVARAVPTVTLAAYAGGWATVTDNGAGDSNPISGIIDYSVNGGGWTAIVELATSYPLDGSLTAPKLDLNFLAVSGGAAGPLYLYASINGLGPTTAGTFASIGGTTVGNVSFHTYADYSNVLFGTAIPLSSGGPYSGPSFSANVAGGVINTAGPYSLTDVVIITHTGGGTTTGDLNLSVPDSGTTLMLLGAGLAGLGLVSRLRRRSS